MLLVLRLVLALLMTSIGLQTASETPAPVFRSSVDLVRLAAVVRDPKGRFVRDLTRGEFEVFDRGRMAGIKDFRQEVAGLSVALLFDVSGSMEGQLVHARDTAQNFLRLLDPSRDEVAVFQFDTRLEETVPFTTGLKQLPPSMSKVRPFGATSLFDAVARTAERINVREGRRHAVIVLTDGLDNASKLTAAQVSGVASAIDVPVYVIGIDAGGRAFTPCRRAGEPGVMDGRIGVGRERRAAAGLRRARDCRGAAASVRDRD